MHEHPGVIYRLDRELRARRGIEGGRPWGKSREKVSDTAGLFEADLLIQSSYDPDLRGSSPPAGLEQAATGLLRGRSKALQRDGFRASAPFDALARFDMDLGDPVIGAWTLLRRFLPDLSGTESGIFTHATRLDLYCAVNATATQLEITCSEAATIAQSLRAFGMQLDGLDEAAALPRLSEAQLRLLSLENDGQAPWRAVITPARIICCSIQAKTTVEEMHAQAASLTHLVQAVPELTATSAVRDHPTQIQVALLESDRYYPVRFTGTLSITRLARVAKRLNVPIRQVVKEARPLLGDVVQAQQEERLERLAALPEPAVDLLDEVNLHPDLWTGRLHAGRLIAKALAQSIPLAQVINDARPLTDLGIEIPRLNPAGEVEAVDRRCLKLLSWNLDADYLYRNDVSRGQLLRAAVEWSISVEHVREIAEPLRGLGVEVTDIDAMDRSLIWDEALVLALQPLGRYIAWGRGRLDPWWLASCCVECNKDPTDFREPLDLLQAFDIDVDECLRFADFCAGEGAGSTG